MLKDMAQGLTAGYKCIQFIMMYGGLSFNLEQVQSSIQHLYLDNLSPYSIKPEQDRSPRRGHDGPASPRLRPSGFPTAAGHYQRGCALFTKDNNDRKPACE